MASALDKYRKDHFLGFGWAFPVTFSVGNYQLDTSEYEKNINESIRLLLSTQKESRCMNPNYGSGLQQYFFQKLDEALKGQIKQTVQFTLLNHEPRITVNSIFVEFSNEQIGLVLISINYTNNQTNTRHNYVYPFSVNEGTNLSSIQ